MGWEGPDAEIEVAHWAERPTKRWVDGWNGTCWSARAPTRVRDSEAGGHAGFRAAIASASRSPGPPAGRPRASVVHAGVAGPRGHRVKCEIRPASRARASLLGLRLLDRGCCGVEPPQGLVRRPRDRGKRIARADNPGGIGRDRGVSVKGVHAQTDTERGHRAVKPSVKGQVAGDQAFAQAEVDAPAPGWRVVRRGIRGAPIAASLTAAATVAPHVARSVGGEVGLLTAPHRRRSRAECGGLIRPRYTQLGPVGRPVAMISVPSRGAPPAPRVQAPPPRLGPGCGDDERRRPRDGQAEGQETCRPLVDPNVQAEVTRVLGGRTRIIRQGAERDPGQNTRTPKEATAESIAARARPSATRGRSCQRPATLRLAPDRMLPARRASRSGTDVRRVVAHGAAVPRTRGAVPRCRLTDCRCQRTCDQFSASAITWPFPAKGLDRLGQIGIRVRVRAH